MTTGRRTGLELPADAFRYRGARALTILHDQHLRAFLATWRRAKAQRVTLPVTDHDVYASMETLLRHVLGAAVRYMEWMCRRLELPDPGFGPPPDVEEVAAAPEAFLEHVLARWSLPLRQVEVGRFNEVYESNWGVPHSIEALMEHAVMHPIRHSFQLEELMGER